MAANNRKKKTLLAVACATVALVALAGCDDIEAKPNGSVYDENILAFDGNTDVTNNTMGKIYDALVTKGDTNSAKVLSNILYIYSQSIYGPFFDDSVLGKGLKTVVDEYEADNTAVADIQAFADKYSAFKNDDASAAHVGNIDKVVNFYLEVLYKLRTTFLGYVNNSSYQVRSKFQEKLFHDAQVKSYYTLGDSYIQDYRQADGSFRVSSAYEETGSIILDAKGDSTKYSSAYFADIFGTYANYISISLLPDIYRSELIAEYLYTQNLGQLKLTPARKVDFISLADNATYPGYVERLMKSYSKLVIKDETNNLDSDDYGFPFLENLYKGTLDGMTAAQKTEAAKIYDDAGWTKSTFTVNGVSKDYYLQSSYGTDIVKSYLQISDNRFADGSTAAWNTFTSNGTYSLETGLAVKTQELIAKNQTTNGWYTSSSSLSALPSSLSGRLFKVQVANEVDGTAWDATSGKYVSDDGSFKYGHYYNGNYYLVPDTVESSNQYPFLVYSSSNWYIVKVAEASKYAKLNSTSSAEGDSASNYYDNMAKHAGDKFFAEQVSRQIAYSLSSSETYKNTANQYYVDQMALIYHDTYVYNYFKTTFPDLFD